ncbi:MAG TPA: hypothetical protein HPP77_09935 [Candidatus Hydrogenedentes bacterium]|nr:hypothetical protein [Candidatus Hydrogenedentota bacterium]
MRRFAKWFFIVALVVVASTGIFIHFAARGTDIAVAQRGFLGIAKWYVLDVHVVFGFLLVLLGVVYCMIRLFARDEKGSARRRGLLRRVLPIVVAVALGGLLVLGVVEHHPVLVADVRATSHPATDSPDQVVLTWSDDPRTTQAVQWRTAAGIEECSIRYRSALSEVLGEWAYVQALNSLLEDPQLANDPLNRRHTAVLAGLNPATTYVYQVGCGDTWAPEAAFTTAPAEDVPFTFIYMGDVQNGFEAWGDLLRAAYERHPEAAFLIVAGDLVGNGCDRSQWDAFFHAAKGAFDRRPLVPAVGNHDECDDEAPRMYLELFALPKNGPGGVTPERAYAFEYGNALFVVLDSNLDPATQTRWLEDRLAESQAAWKFVVCHHPAYVSKPHRDSAEMRAEWCPLFDAYHVDMVLQGHDHAYMRTRPMRNGTAVDEPAAGTTYIVSVAGTKFYEQAERDYFAVGFEAVSTYQVVTIDGGRLDYKAYDLDGNTVDAVTIQK